MAARPIEPTQLGKFFAYPQAAAGNVSPYWLASSPGSGHRVRMTGACKRAFIATIEAVIERALAPANCDTYPAVNTNFLTTALDAQGIRSLVNFGKLAAVSDRAGLVARLKRGCPREDWNLLVSLVAAMWVGVPKSIPAGMVYAWQTGTFELVTDGWIEVVDGGLYVGISGVYDLSAYCADRASDSYPGVPVFRPWGAYCHGSGGSAVVDWLSDTLLVLSGASVFADHDHIAHFAEDVLDGTPAPLKAGNEGNWFGSSASAIVGQHITMRRSSSAWAVLQAMLANMRFTHLSFPYSIVYNVTRQTRTHTRTITLDASYNIVVSEVGSNVDSDDGMDTNCLHTELQCYYYEGLSWIGVNFYCADSDIDADNPLVLFAFPGNDGWSRIGSALDPYLSLGPVHAGDHTLELAIVRPNNINGVTAADGHTYPGAGFEQYINAYGGVTFVDKMAYWHADTMADPDWTKYRVIHENGNRDLSVPVTSHAQRLLGELPTISFPSVPANPGTLGTETARFWNGWRVKYPSTPNIQVNGQDAYFPVAFKNPTFVDHSGWAITHDLSAAAWKGGSGSDPDKGEVFGIPGMAFPDFDPSSVDTPTYEITFADKAMAAYQWRFKAMPAA